MPHCAETFIGASSTRSNPKFAVMARKLKVFQTSLGFFDQAIAAPSMKAALEAWRADSNLFHQGAAKESKDPDVVAATMANPASYSSVLWGRTGASRSMQTCPRIWAMMEAGRHG
jgi:hypothetical protein